MTDQSGPAQRSPAWIPALIVYTFVVTGLATAPGIGPEPAAQFVALAAPAYASSHPEWAGFATGLDDLYPTVGGEALIDVVSRLETAVPEAMAREEVPGAAVAVVGEGRLLWAKGYGVDSSSGEPVTGDTVFVGASFSKPLTAYLALKLVEDGVLELDRPLIEYTGEAYLPDPRIQEVTLRMVLSHTSGFSDMTSGRGWFDLDPGEEWAYSNDALRYLQWVIERVTGERFGPYAQEHLFEPLGMTHTSFLWQDAFEDLATYGHEPWGLVPPNEPARANAAFGVLTTASDYARFVVALMNPIEDDPVRLSPGTLEALMVPQPNAAVAEGVSWGLGVGLEAAQAGDCFWQWGWLTGYRHLVVGCPETGAAVIVLTNGAGGLRVGKAAVLAVLPGYHALFPNLMDHWGY